MGVNTAREGEEDSLKKTRHTATQIVGMLREAEALLGTGKSIPEVARHLGIGESTFYRWRGEYTGVQVDAVTRLAGLEGADRRVGVLAVAGGVHGGPGRRGHAAEGAGGREPALEAGGRGAGAGHQRSAG